MRMRRGVLAALTLDGVASAATAPTITYNASMANTTGTDASIASTGTIPAGRIVMYEVSATSARSISTITDTTGETWNIGTVYFAGTFAVHFAWKLTLAPMGVTTITVTLTGSASKQAQLIVFTGLDTTAPIAGYGTGAQGASTTPTSGAITPTAAGNLIMSQVGVFAGVGDTFTEDARFGNQGVRDGTTNRNVVSFFTAPDTTAITKADTNSVSRSWISRLTELKVA